MSIFVYVGSVVKGNQKTIESFTAISVVLAISCFWKVVGTFGIMYCPATAKGAAARTAETPPIILRKSRRDNPTFFFGEAPSNSVAVELPQQFRKSLQLKHELVKFLPRYEIVFMD
jgi:hypothetical protein